MDKFERLSNTCDLPVNRWRLVRHDDNGNQSVVAAFNSKEEAG